MSFIIKKDELEICINFTPSPNPDSSPTLLQKSLLWHDHQKNRLHAVQLGTSVQSHRIGRLGSGSYRAKPAIGAAVFIDFGPDMAR